MTPLAERKPPTGALRLLLRLPVYLYRAGLGSLLSSRFLLLTHRGRKTGLPRQTVVEVVSHDRASGTYYIASGWGEKAHWFRNVQQTPEVTVQVGRRRFVATAERLRVDAARKVLLAYAQHHPVAFRALAKAMTGRRFPQKDEDWAKLVQAIPVLALKRYSGAALDTGSK